MARLLIIMTLQIDALNIHDRFLFKLINLLKIFKNKKDNMYNVLSES